MEAVDLLDDRQGTGLDLDDATRRIRTLDPGIGNASTFIELHIVITGKSHDTVSEHRLRVGRGEQAGGFGNHRNFLAFVVDVPLVVGVDVDADFVQVAHVRHAAREFLRLDKAEINASVVKALGLDELLHEKVIDLGAKDHVTRSKAAVLDHGSLDSTNVGEDVGGSNVRSRPLLRERRLRLFVFAKAAPEIHRTRCP